MNLEQNQKLTLQDLGILFGVSSQTVSKNKQKYFELLEEYADYEVVSSPKGRFKHIVIKEVYDAEPYYKSYKQDFINWLSTEDVFALTGEKGYSNLTVVTNYYCNLNDIPYDGPHYLYETFEGRTTNGKRKLVEDKKVPNDVFRTWHYLYQLARRECKKLGYSIADNEPKEMRSADFNPVYLQIMSDKDKEKYNEICYEVYGKGAVAYGVDISSFIEDMELEDMTAEEMRQLLREQQEYKALTDKDKRKLFITKLSAAGLLKYRGWPWTNSNQ